MNLRVFYLTRRGLSDGYKLYIIQSTLTGIERLHFSNFPTSISHQYEVNHPVSQSRR